MSSSKSSSAKAKDRAMTLNLVKSLSCPGGPRFAIFTVQTHVCLLSDVNVREEVGHMSWSRDQTEEGGVVYVTVSVDGMDRRIVESR